MKALVFNKKLPLNKGLCFSFNLVKHCELFAVRETEAG